MTTLKEVRKVCIAAVAAICAGVGLIGMPARADLTITMQFSMKFPKVPQSYGMDSSSTAPTIYVSGKKCLLKDPTESALIDPSSQQIVKIDDTSKTYTVLPFSPIPLRAMVQAGPSGVASKPKVVDTGETISILGHKARHYVVTQIVTQGPTAGMHITTDIYAAEDLPAADLAAYSALTAGDPAKYPIRGVTLKTVVTIVSASGKPMENLINTFEATSISTAPIPASVFSIPQGYTKTQAPSDTPPPGMH